METFPAEAQVTTEIFPASTKPVTREIFPITPAELMTSMAKKADNGGDIVLERFKKSKKLDDGSYGLKDPKTGEYIEKDRGINSGSGSHGGSLLEA